MNARKRCPRCGSENVGVRGENLPAKCEADLYAPTSDESIACSDCGLLESCLSNAGKAYDAFRKRWHWITEPIPPEEWAAHRRKMDRWEEEQARAWTWPVEEDDIHDRQWRANYQRERRAKDTELYYWYENGQQHCKPVGALPIQEALISQIIANPEDVSPRWALVAWLRTIDHELAPEAALFMEGQLRLAESCAKNPRADIKDQLPDSAFIAREDKLRAPDQPWWRFPSVSVYDFLAGLEHVGLVDGGQYYRGFVEHVAIKASRFLEIADELYSLAPIRQLTITYCKGPNHDDQGLWRALLGSPHLDRIRAVKLPVRKFGPDKGDVTELNRLTDDDVALLAASHHLRGLRHLDLEDQRKLTIRAFDALATSKQLPELSAVRYDINRYWHPGTFSFGRAGKQKRALAALPLRDDYGPKLEARHGRIPWLRIAENYGTEAPDVEAVIEHPVALRGSLRDEGSA